MKDSGQFITMKNVDDIKIKSNKRYYLLTFDDGNLSDFNIVFPLLQELKIKATFFINPKTVGNKNFMNWAMVEEMSEYGMCIGSHSYSHHNMQKLKIRDAKKEFDESKEIISKKINQKVDFFAFPYGKYNNTLVQLAISCGYDKCFVSKHGVISSGNLIIPRNSINGSMSFYQIDKVLECSIYTRVKWIFLDSIKSILKNTLGEKIYIHLRKIALQ
tara:strand:- start:573 stop:1220 length:648 start_codon:yes stop_codon:yes gene_type:complete